MNPTDFERHQSFVNELRARLTAVDLRQPSKPEDFELLETLVRLEKGCLKAYEHWLNCKKKRAA